MTAWSVCLFVCRGQGQRQEERTQLHYYNQGHCMILVLHWNWHPDITGMLHWAICLQLPFNLSPEGQQGWHTGKWDERHKNHVEMTLSESLDPVDLKASPSQIHKPVNSLSWWKLGLCHLRLKTFKHNVQILSGGDTIRTSLIREHEY